MKIKKKKMGRPRLNPKDKRRAVVTLRLTQEERELLEKEANTQSLSVSSYLLKCWKKGGM
jgi:uncharacterized protein (DUF1778 family)